MENSKKNEYIVIAVVNLLLVLYTSIFLYGSPYALYNLFSVHTLLSVLGWTLYAGSLYLILARSEKGTEIRQQQIVTALRIGAGTGVLKAVIDVLTNYLLSYIVPSNIIGTAVKGIRNGALGFAFLYLLFRHFYKERGRTVKVSRKQKGAMAVLTVCYILALILIRIQVMLQFSALDSENMYAMYAYFMQGATAGINEVNSINKWFFAVFMILWWQIMRTCYIEGD